MVSLSNDFEFNCGNLPIPFTHTCMCVCIYVISSDMFIITFITFPSVMVS